MSFSELTPEEIRADHDRVSAEIREQIKNVQGVELPEGAERCGNCGTLPVAMIKTPAHLHAGDMLPDLFEVGCVICPPFYVEHPEGSEVKLDGKPARVKRRSFSARAYTLDGAVARWNDGNHVEDDKLDLNVPSKEKKRIGR